MTKKFSDTTQIFSANSIFLEELYEKYSENPESIDNSWREFFAQFDDNSVKTKNSAKVIGAEPFDSSSLIPITKKVEQQPKATLQPIAKSLADAYRRYGHLISDLDPLNLLVRPVPQELCDQAEDGEKFKAIYSNKIGYEFCHISSSEERLWLEERIESQNITATKSQKLRIMNKLIQTEGFEQFAHKKFPGTKRFSIEGGDAVIPSICAIIDKAGDSGVKEMVIGMAHRGRLNMLTTVMQKPYRAMFAEFRGESSFPETINTSGDVKYHLGFSNDITTTAGNKIHLSLSFNPSHLEAVNGVVAGRVRAKQDQMDDRNERLSALGLLIHGDAAFAGQGSVAEALAMSNIDGYRVGGIMHIIINNQVGFTASPEEGRSGTYCSDLAKMIEAPIFHVNGDDVLAVVRASELLTEYRQKFGKDAVLDLYCYRRYGHNEGDEPLFTQPIMYNKINKHQTLLEIYSQNLIAEGLISQDELVKTKAEFYEKLELELKASMTYKPEKADWLEGKWSKIQNHSTSLRQPETCVKLKDLKLLGTLITSKPDENFSLNPKIARLIDTRRTMFESGDGLDWGAGEALAFASLLADGFNVRITGQDCERGTFSHRQSVYADSITGAKYTPLNNLGKKQNAAYEVHNSLLSEFAVMGFEYGYSLAEPNTLTLWEGQFGDFANGAQVIFDQFISSSESKWLRVSGLVLLLPHGYEGQGPEHSSARLERYLQACAEDNIQVANCTTPASLFHILRRQMKRKYRKPLVIMTPKSLLRHKLAISSLKDFAEGTSFQPLIGDATVSSEAKKMILCSGKVYYDLLDAKATNVALVRLEQLYPFPSLELKSELAKYQNLKEIIWCQEEPKNMGAWSFVRDYIEEISGMRPRYAGRKPSASPATGYASVHAAEQAALIKEAYLP